MGGTRRSFPVRAVASIVLVTVVISLIPMIVSGDWGWPEAWAYAALIVLAAAISRGLAARRSPDLIADRSRLRGPKNTKPWDKVIMPLHTFMPVVMLIVAGLDRAYAWPPDFSPGVNIAALVVMILMVAFGSWAVVENRFFALTVGIQKERGHYVVSTGPYRFVRHPGYTGSLIGNLLTPFLLDSAWAFVPAVVLAVVVIVRTAMEDKTLQEELPGYREYAERTRYRLVPGIW